MRRTFALPAKRAGLSFAELAIVLAIVGVLSCIGLAAVREARKKACRARAQGLLNYVYRLEILHCGVQGRYTAEMGDLKAMGLPDIVDPFYEFRIESSDTGEDFTCLAWANLDFDALADTLFVDQTGVIKLLAED
jgi:Tfp pilus assembly protein PilE